MCILFSCKIVINCIGFRIWMFAARLAADNTVADILNSNFKLLLLYKLHFILSEKLNIGNYICKLYFSEKGIKNNTSILLSTTVYTLTNEDGSTEPSHLH